MRSFLGYGAESGNLRLSQGFNTSGGNAKGIPLGVEFAALPWTYLNLSIEGYFTYGLNSTDGTGQFVMHRFGGLALVEGAAPVSLGTAELRFRLGGGYGAQGQNFNIQNFLGNASDYLGGYGPHVSAAIELKARPTLLLFVDYARSIGAKSLESLSAGTIRLTIDETRLERMRLGLTVPVTIGISLGGVFVVRRVFYRMAISRTGGDGGGSDIPTADVSVTDATLAFLFQYDW